jgi:transcriptional regulator with XRE-family HTH domain
MILALKNYDANKKADNMQKWLSAESEFSVNLRFLLWRSGIDNNSWVQTIAAWLRCPRSRALRLMTNEQPTQAEVDELAGRLGSTSEELRFTNLVGDLGDDLFFENLRYLVAGVEHGDKKQLAQSVGVHATSLSRWIGGLHKPDARNIALLAKYFGLRSSTELTQAPLFLSLRPVGAGQQRQWLVSAIETLDQREIGELFPALYKLLT